MKTLKNVLLIVVGLIVLLVLVGFLLPREVHVERSAKIGAAPSAVYDVLISPREFNSWSPWAEMDTTMVPEYFGPESGVGAGFTWSSEEDDVGTGKYEITKVTSNERVDVALDFGEMGTSMSSMIIEAVGDSTQVTWTLDTDMGFGPIGRYFGLMMDAMVGSDYEKGLAKLDSVMQNRKTWRIDNIEESISEPFSMLSVRETFPAQSVGDMLGRSYGAIMEHITAQNLEVSSPPFAIYHHWPQDGEGEADVEAAIPISAPNKGSATVKGSEFAGGNVVVAYFYGPYEESENAHTAIHMWAEEHGKILDGAPWEVYVTDPQMEPNSSEWLTLVCYRVHDAPAM